MCACGWRVVHESCEGRYHAEAVTANAKCFGARYQGKI